MGYTKFQDDEHADFLSRLLTCTDGELLKITENAIWLSAFASNKPYSNYHRQADACYGECIRRGKLDLYREAQIRASKS